MIRNGWRTTWWAIGLALLFGLALLSVLLVRKSPEAGLLENDGEVVQDRKADIGFTLWQALATPSFWVFGIASAVYGLIASGIALFNESILAERGFDATTYHRSLVIVALTALAGNFLGGWLTSRWKMNRLLVPINASIGWITVGIATREN